MSNIPINQRNLWLGASEVAALFGVSPYCTRFELFHMKAGSIPAHDLDGQERIQAGQFLEPSIGAWAAHKWNWPIRNVKEYLTHPTVERMGASLDFATVESEPVEIKNVDNLVFRNGEWEVDGDIILDAPAHFLLQVQHQLACSPRKDRGWLIVCVGGNRLYRMEVPRHEKMITRIEREVEQFWADVLAGNEPKPDFEADAAAIALLYGGTGDEFADLRGDDHAKELCAEYLSAHEIEREAAKRKKAALAEIKTLMSDAQGALVDEGFKVKASFIKEATIVRKPHWRFSVTQKKQET